jgi:hypothetical protein
MKLELWNRTSYVYDSLSSVATLTEEDEGYIGIWNDTSGYKSWDGYWVARMSGFFVPPKSGVYTLYIIIDDVGELYFSKTGDAAHKVGDSTDIRVLRRHCHVAT